MNDERMSAVVFARKLRTRRANLKAKHKREMGAYPVAFEAWRKTLVAWLLANARARVASLSRNDTGSSGYHRDTFREKIMHGCPEPPKKPSDSTIRKIDGALRRIAITGQTKVSVSERDLEELFGDAIDEDE